MTQPPATQPPATPPPAARRAVITLDKGGQIVLELFTTDAPDTWTTSRSWPRGASTTGSASTGWKTGSCRSAIPSPDAAHGFPRHGHGRSGYTIKAEFNQRPHERGALGMARSRDPDSAGSQFYILRKPARGLDGQYTVFGRVVRGMDLVDAIKVGDRVKSVKVTD